jgi:hypothetical protein
MMSLKKIYLLLFLGFLSSPHIQAETHLKPKHEIMINPLDTVLYPTILAIWKASASSKHFANNLIYIPIHFESFHAISNKWGLNFGLSYRYEDYQKKQNDDFDNLRAWTKHHEIFALGGVYYNFREPSDSGYFGGPYISAKIGPGFGFSPIYNYASILIKTEFGYAFEGNNPIFTRIGGGFTLNNVFHESPEAILNYEDLSLLGLIIHRIMPHINIAFGYRF